MKLGITTKFHEPAQSYFDCIPPYFTNQVF